MNRLIPAPNFQKTLSGNLTLSADRAVHIVCPHPRLSDVAKQVADVLRKAGLQTRTHESGVMEPAQAVELMLSGQEAGHPEGYRLRITEKGVKISGKTPAGLYYGVQSLRQLLPVDPHRSGEIVLPCLEVRDEPRYPWRGFMLDESRHFFGKDYVKKILDWMAFAKLNRFHWHLTDEPAWRIEIKAYPRLTEVGSTGSWSDPEEPAAFYTHEDIREIVAYAAERHVTIVPEIDMPGHATAANRAYPAFSGGGSERCPEFTFHPGKAETYTYLETILTEVMELFPGPWLHFGGDEVHFGNEQWQTDPHVQALMKTENLPDLQAVEYYFITRMAGFIAENGRTPIGWDEIAESPIPADSAALMWWRHDLRHILEISLKKGYKTILCPRIPCYFDFVQHDAHAWGRRWEEAFGMVGDLYGCPDRLDLPEAGREHIIGLSGCLWTEQVKGTDRADFMAFPRLFALAEAAWCQEATKDIDSFKKRLEALFPLLEAEGTRYFNCLHPARTPEVAGVNNATRPVE